MRVSETGARFPLMDAGRESFGGRCRKPRSGIVMLVMLVVMCVTGVYISAVVSASKKTSKISSITHPKSLTGVRPYSTALPIVFLSLHLCSLHVCCPPCHASCCGLKCIHIGACSAAIGKYFLDATAGMNQQG